MSTVQEARTVRTIGPRETIADAIAMTWRNLLKYVRVPALLVFSTVQPIMFVLLFAYVFGGAISTPGVENYIDFLMPGIFVQTVLFGSTQTGVGLADDLSKGMIDRFRSLPMARSAVLAGRTLSDTVRNFFVVCLMTGVGYLIGFRFHAGLLPALGAMALVVLFGFAFSWISANIGLAVRDTETAQTAGFIWLFPLVFASSIFVPVQTMPGWLQAVAKVNPISAAVNAARALCLGGPTAGKVLSALLWGLLICVIFVPLAVRRYRRMT
ncbi:MAG: type transport system permease protein [Actinomycetota bacterium]|nr:type transport system permease protein [Actinomycetota bacterium]